MNLDHIKSLARDAYRDGADAAGIVDAIAGHIAVDQTLHFAGYLAANGDDNAADILRSAIATDYPAEARDLIGRHSLGPCGCGCVELWTVLQEREALVPLPDPREALHDALAGLERLSRLVAEASAEIRQKRAGDRLDATRGAFLAACPRSEEPDPWAAWERGPFRPIDTDPDLPPCDEIDDDSEPETEGDCGAFADCPAVACDGVTTIDETIQIVPFTIPLNPR